MWVKGSGTVLRPLHESYFTCMLRRLQAPTVAKITQSVIYKHKLPHSVRFCLT